MRRMSDRVAGRVLDIRGASENTLRDLDVRLSGGLTAVVGVSGSGKSSLVFDTVFHEARRRFLGVVVPRLTVGPAASGPGALHRRPRTCGRDRPERGQPQPALDSGDRGRHPPVPAHPLRDVRRAEVSALRRGSGVRGPRVGATGRVDAGQARRRRWRRPRRSGASGTPDQGQSPAAARLPLRAVRRRWRRGRRRMPDWAADQGFAGGPAARHRPPAWLDHPVHWRR